jgi:hypothetical protein
MTVPGAPPPGFLWPVVTPGPVESMALYFLSPLIAPTPVATRLPNDTIESDIAYGFVRVEAGPGPRRNLTEYNQTILLHTYVPFEYEVTGEQIGNNVIAYMGAAGGLTIAGRYVVEVPRISTLQRRTDPKVNLLRYLAFVTWTIAGEPVNT